MFKFCTFKYAVESQIRLHGLNPEECMILIKPREVKLYFIKKVSKSIVSSVEL